MKLTGTTASFIRSLTLAALAASATWNATATELQLFQRFSNVDHRSFGVGGLRGFQDFNAQGTFNVTGVSGTIHKAYLYWHGHGRAAEESMTVGGMDVGLSNDTAGTYQQFSGARVGISGPNGWSFSPYSFKFGAAFRADVTSVVTGNGSYTIKDFGLLWTAIQGASLIVIFNDADEANNRDVTIYDGCDQNSTAVYDADGWNLFLTGVPYNVGDAASLEFHVSDGQNIYNESPILLNQQELTPFGNIFTGSAPWNTTSGYDYNFFSGSLWDVKTFDIAPFLSVGNNNVSVTTGFADEHMSLVVALLSTKTAGGTSAPPPQNLYAPTLTCPAPVTLQTSGASATHTTTVTVQDLDGDTLSVVWRVNGVQVRQDTVTGTSPKTQATLSLTRTYATGTHSLAVSVMDSGGRSQICNTHITVSSQTTSSPPINNPPTARPDSASTLTGVPVAISVLGNDTDPDGDALTITTHTQPTHGSVVLSASGVFTYTPPAGFIGTVTFTYTISDGKGGVSTTTVTVVVTGLQANNPPLAINDSAATSVSTPVSISVLGNDSDPENDPLTITAFTQPSNGSVVLGSDGRSFLYTPPANFTGVTTFTYTITDGRGTSTATVTVSVTGGPSTPTQAGACALYPIALHIANVRGLAPGSVIGDVKNGVQAGEFGWLTWAGSPREPTLVTSLTPPGDSHTYINPDNPADGVISIGDWIEGATGIMNSSEVRASLDVLKTMDIVIPVWDAVRKNGNNSDYRVVNFALIRILDYHLPNRNINTITARFLGFTQCGSGTPPPPPPPAEPPPVTPPSGPCAPCDGKVSKLSLRYNGSVTGNIVVIQRDGSNLLPVFSGMVQPGQTFTFSGVDKQQTLGANITIRVNGSWSTDIHTSCSVPIGIGQTWGIFTIVDGYSRNGGKLCPLQ